MDDYYERDIPTAFEMSKMWNRLSDSCYIDLEDYTEEKMSFKWEENVFYPMTYDEKIKDSKLVRIYNIKIRR